MKPSVYLLVAADLFEKHNLMEVLKGIKMKKPQEVAMITGGTFRKAMREPGRNEPCPCGSGEKFKRCCLDKGYAAITEKVVAASKKNMEAGK